MNKKSSLAILLIAILSSCKSGNKEAADSPAPVNIKEENVQYSSDTVSLNGFIAYNDADTSKRPVVLIIHEWWGLNEYVKQRARQLADLGYVAMAIDLYGNGTVAATPDEAKAHAFPLYQNPQTARQRFEAAMEKVKAVPVADASQMAAIGYCFGGAVALNMARMGEDLKGVVSFHGSLMGVPAEKEKLRAAILVCHGDSDQSVSPEEVQQFRHEMDSIGADYTVKIYPKATHAFTNPAATETGKKYSMPIEYNEAADTASFNDMITFFKKIF